MKPNNENTAVVQGAAVWNEQQKHEEIMKELAGVRGYRYVDYGDPEASDEPYVGWREDVLTLNQLKEIMERGRHDEIMQMINCYNHAVSEEDQQQAHHAAYLSVPEEIQELIAKRNNAEEMNAYLSVQGFGAKGQDVVLARGDHLEILNYVARHGLLPLQQKKLMMRHDNAEIEMHILHHGLCPELMDDIFNRLIGGDTGAFYQFIWRHELSVDYQIVMLNVVASPEFYAYIDRYGLWMDTHVVLVEKRNNAEIAQYIRKHHVLSPAAERKLAERGNAALNRLYIGSQHEFSSTNFLNALLAVKPLDYDAVAETILATRKVDTMLSDVEEHDERLMQNGSPQEVASRLEKGVPLHLKALGNLFFRDDNHELFNLYLKNCPKGRYVSGNF